MDYQDNIHEKIREKSYLLKICTIIMFTGHYPLHYYPMVGDTIFLWLLCITWQPLDQHTPIWKVAKIDLRLTNFFKAFIFFLIGDVHTGLKFVHFLSNDRWNTILRLLLTTWQSFKMHTHPENQWKKRTK